VTSEARQAALDRARQGDAQALGALLDSFRGYLGKLMGDFRDERLKGRVGKSDLIQDAWLEAHRSFAGFRGTTVGQFVAWLRKLALRSAGRTVRGLLDEPHPDQAPEGVAEPLANPGSSPSAQAVRNELATRVTEALARLPEGMQQVLLLRLVDGLPHAAIAERLGVAEASARVLYVRALGRLREFYKGDRDDS